MRTILITLALSVAVGGGAVAEPRYDFTLRYEARDTLTRGADGFDNDRFIGQLGATWDTAGGGFRAALNFGVRNEDFSGAYPLDVTGEAVSFRRSGATVWGLGARLGGVGNQALSAEVGLAGEYQRAFWTARAFTGVQGLTEDWPNDTDPSADLFLVTEGTVYPADWLLLRAGATLDSRGDPLGSIGGEIRPFNGPLSLFADWVVSTDEFRDEAFYNDFSFGLALSFNFGSLKARDRAQQQRLIARPVSAQ